MKTIYTIRDVAGQRAFMWDQRRIEEEVAACAHRAIARYFHEWLPPDAPILEAGCGLGAWVVYLSDRGYDVVGVDNDAAVLDRLRAWRPTVKVHCGDVRELPFADGTMGAVISLGVVEHFPEGWGPALREARRVLRPEGLLFLTVPLENVFRRVFAHPLRAAYLWRRKRRGEAVHFAEFRYRPHEVTARVREAGFEPLRLDWDDFAAKTRCLGIWTDFPPLHAGRLFEMNRIGRGLAWVGNTLSPWSVASGVFCLARKV